MVTARRPTDSDPMLAAIHSPTVRKALGNKWPARRAISEAHAPAPAIWGAVAHALAR